MKSQLLQSCQGCAPSNIEAPPRHRGPIPAFPKGKEQHPNILKLSGNELPPLGEGWGGAFRRIWGGASISSCFFTANAGLFERPKAAFFTVAADGVMPRMTVGMVETTRRKTRFPTIGATVHTKAKPTATATAFCVYVIPL